MKHLAAVAMLAFSAAAFGQAAAPADAAAAGGRHFYVGGGVGQAHWRPGCPSSVTDCDDMDPSVHAFAGYQLNAILAGEIAFTNFGKADGTGSEIKGHGWEASLVAGWPVFGNVSVIGRLGIYRGVAKGGGQFAGHTETNFGPTFGLGAQMEFTPNLAARIEWQSFPGLGGSTITDNDINVISVGALWRFR